MNAVDTAAIPNFRAIAFLLSRVPTKGAVDPSINPQPRARDARPTLKGSTEGGISGTLCQEGFAVENSVHSVDRILRARPRRRRSSRATRVGLLQAPGSSVVAEARRFVVRNHDAS